MTDGPDPERLADAKRRAAFYHSAGSNRDANRILAIDVLCDFIDEIHEGTLDEVAWALLWAEKATDLEPHEERIREDVWKKINDDAGRAESERRLENAGA